jgi:hypothetical protein
MERAATKDDSETGDDKEAGDYNGREAWQDAIRNLRGLARSQPCSEAGGRECMGCIWLHDPMKSGEKEEVKWSDCTHGAAIRE